MDKNDIEGNKELSSDKNINKETSSNLNNNNDKNFFQENFKIKDIIIKLLVYLFYNN